MRAILALEDGRIFEGESFGATGTRVGEVCFNTSMTGYQEVLTDPSYRGQIVAMTYPLIGNYGTNAIDQESNHPHVRGFVIEELSEMPSNWRAEESLDDQLSRKWSLQGGDQVLPPIRHRIVAFDYGMKRNILRSLRQRGFGVTVVPATTTAEEVLALNPEGVFLSNGPGDPEALPYAHKTVRGLIGRKPIFGICLGHQVLGFAFGGRTFKLKFGHRGGNQPVKDLRSGKVAITAQNHGFAVDPDSLSKEIEVTHVNLNDGTVEGMRHKELPIFSVQYHPEAAPGPHDASYFFDQFAELIDGQTR